MACVQRCGWPVGGEAEGGSRCMGRGEQWRCDGAVEESAHAEEVEFLKKTNDQLKANLESLLSAKK